MQRRSPPWGAIEAFIVAARSGSFKNAAAELRLSPPAFSRRIQTLERYLRLSLFDRQAAGPVLTPAGRRYLERLQPGYDAIRAAADWMSPDPARRPLRIGVSQSFAICWLMPRLSRLYEATGIELVLQTNQHDVDLRAGGVDACIRYGGGDWPHVVSRKLLDLELMVVCAPSLAPGVRVPTRPADLPFCRALDLVLPGDQWEEWCSAVGMAGMEPRERIQFDSLQLMYDAASRGLGIALGARPLVEPFLADGRLRIAFDLQAPAAGAYYLSALPGTFRQPGVIELWQWLVAESLGEPKPLVSAA